jgi:hypothetical protein
MEANRCGSSKNWPNTLQQNKNRLDISADKESMWQRLQAHFDSPPDILSDLIAPVMSKKWMT